MQPDTGTQFSKFWTATLLMFVVLSGNAQKVFTVDYASQAQAVLFETKVKSEADILIYKIAYASQVNPEKGLWLDVDYKSQSQWLVYWTDRRSESSCVVFFVPYRSQATRNKCYLDSPMNNRNKLQKWN